MTDNVEFRAFPKIPRFSRDIIITEKLDGTNAQIYIAEDGQTMLTGSRNRWITPEDDNYGFAAWAQEHKEQLLELGPGHHYGEWWGKGIQRGYGLNEKRFSLFNAGRWTEENTPSCVSVVPVIFGGMFSEAAINYATTSLKEYGSWASEGFMNPEGIMIYHTAARQYFKKTIHKDEQPKGNNR